MDTKELFDLIKARRRMCRSMECDDCPLHFVTCCFDGNLEDIDDLDRIIRTVKEWDAAHPVLEPLGDNIYFDPKHRIVPDEITRVYTIEVTYVEKGGRVWGEEKMKDWRKDVAPQWLKWIGKAFAGADDVKCAKVQQFVTKCHEEEI